MRRRLAVTFMVWALATLPFLDKAFHIDDVTFLQLAQHLRKDPAHPYSFKVHFGEEDISAFGIYHPPIFPAYLAAVSSLDGGREREVVLHLGLSLFTALAAFSLYGLAERFKCPPGPVAAAVLLSPMVLPGYNVMLDLPVLAVFLLSMHLHVTGVDRGSRLRIVAAVTILSAGALIKYNTLVLFPLLALYSISRRRWADLGYFAIPIAVMGAWTAHNIAVYGRPHLIAQVGIADRSPSRLLDNVICGFRFLGCAVFWLPLVVKRDRYTAAAAILAIVASAAFAGRAEDARVAAFLYGANGVFVVAMILRHAPGRLRELAARRLDADPAALDDLFLYAWLAAVVLFAWWFPPFQAGRHYFCALPPLAFLAFRQVSQRRWAISLVPTVIVGLIAATADMELANCYRAVARGVMAKKPPAAKHVWFVGHWGWEYYAERAGMERLPRAPEPIEAGDLWVTPRHVFKELSVPETVRARFEPLDEVTAPRRLPFYAFRHGRGVYGLMSQDVPYGFTTDPVLDEFEIRRAR